MFIGRKEYLSRLNGLWNKRVSSLVTCRGRRRIGKSTLISEFAKRYADNFVRFEGLPPRPGLDNNSQLEVFCRDLSQQLSLPRVRVESWLDAFQLLARSLPSSGRTVVLLDEISWLGGYDPDFSGQLKIAWDRFFSEKTDLIFVLCGSVSSWIVENILNNSGFAGRNSLDIAVGEVSLRDVREFLGPNSDQLSCRERVDMLSVTGCVPRYLQELDASLTADENIRRLCFCPDGLLFREFNSIFSQLYGIQYEERAKILRLLSGGAMSASEIAHALSVGMNGNLSSQLHELQLAGFIDCDSGLNPQTGGASRKGYYRLKDNYTRFYLKYIEPKARAIQNGLLSFTSLRQLPGLETILGLQFENLVLNHLQELLPCLGLQNTLVESATPYFQQQTKASQACQIDLLIQSKSGIYVVEIKRRKEIGLEIIDEVREKCKRLKYDKKNLSLRTALVYEGTLSPSVREKDFFNFLVPIETLF